MTKLKERIKEKAKSLGFDLVGIAPAEYSPMSHDKLIRWLELGYNADMEYLARAPRKRHDPRLFYRDAKSIVVVGANYYKKPDYNDNQPYISIYARGKTYQTVIRQRLEKLLDFVKQIELTADGKIAVDTSPTADKLWAVNAGIGWRGKNTLVVNKKVGSFIFLGELFLNLELQPDTPEADHCAKCEACVESCPTGALEQPYNLNASKCISYLTTECKSDIANPEMIGNNLFGCDICQLACPFNNKAIETNSPDFVTQYSQSPDIDHLKKLTEIIFKSRYQGTTIAEYGYKIVYRNANIVLSNLKATHNRS